MRRVGLIAGVGTVVALMLVLSLGRGPGAMAADSQHLRAPDFEDVQWLNTDKPLSIKDLRGQVVLLDFWTYCCINCMHIFPDLKYLEKKYHDQPFVVVGVHSGKFDQEKDAGNIRQAILRHNIEHPVAVDNNYTVWKSYAVHSWPTLVVIDPEGYVVGAVAGEGHRDVLDKTIAKLLEEHRGQGTLARQPMRFRMEREAFKAGVLEFPGKVLADEAGKRLFISDTNHHRVLIADLDGRVQEVIGNGRPALVSGTYDKAQFHQPQGLALSEDGELLYVADTENHALRVVDLAKRTVRTLAGNGRQGHSFKADGSGDRISLSSPWDLARVGKVLYVAMAGTHQIWTYDLSSRRVASYAGTGQEARIDKPRESAAFAQPSGLATDGKRLYVADAEISTIRVIDLGDGKVSTLAGSGGLFEFGRDDGVGDKARFQHPLGVALAGERLFVADTFNHLIRTVDVNSRTVGTWLGTGKPEPGTEQMIGLYEPGGLSVAGSVLYIADTNQHRIVAVDLKTRQSRVLEVTLPQSATAPATTGR